MPKSRKKQFIDKKSAQHFYVVHRSQRDPHAADPDAPQHVLAPANGAGKPEATPKKAAPVINTRTDDWELGEYGFPEDGYDYSQHFKSMGDAPQAVFLPAQPQTSTTTTATTTASAAPLKPGVVPTAFNLPPEVFASKEEESVGLLNLAAPTGLDLSIDPEIVSAMEEAEADTDFEVVVFREDQQEAAAAQEQSSDGEATGNVQQNQQQKKKKKKTSHEVHVGGELDDDFVTKAQSALPVDDDADGGSDGSSDDDAHHGFGKRVEHEAPQRIHDFRSAGPGVGGRVRFDDESDEHEGVSMVSSAVGSQLASELDQRSISSSIYTRGGAPSVQDDHFDQFVGKYEDEEIGDLDDEEEDQYGGTLDLADIDDALNEFLETPIEKLVKEHYEPERPQQHQHDGVGDSNDGPGVAPTHATVTSTFHDPPEPQQSHDPLGFPGNRPAHERTPAQSKAAALPEKDAEDVDVVIIPEDGHRMHGKQQWDVETVLSTYTNVDNHPSVISGPTKKNRLRAARTKQLGEASDVPTEIIKLDRNGIPIDPSLSLPGQRVGGEDDAVEEELEGDEESGVVHSVPARQRGETGEQRRARKQAVKAQRADSRRLKKQLKGQFKKEECRQKNAEYSTVSQSGVVLGASVLKY